METGQYQAPQGGGAAYMPSGRQVGANYEVVPGSSLVTSHGPDMQINPDDPANLQPRDEAPATMEDRGSVRAGPLSLSTPIRTDGPREQSRLRLR
jgi:hypothetical protein